MKTRECENCGASLEKDALQCAYCGTWYEKSQEESSPQSLSRKFFSIASLPPGKGEFGVKKTTFFKAGGIMAAVLYAVGWLFEDQHYWLEEKALVAWMGILPLWLFFIAFLWRVNRRVVFHGLVISIIIFLSHIIVIWQIQGYVWDDHVGIAAMIAAGSLVGWLLGRLLHAVIRWRKVHEKR